jgi:hypothetical protein
MAKLIFADKLESFKT